MWLVVSPLFGVFVSLLWRKSIMILSDQEGDIHLKIIPSYREQAPMCQVFVKAHFNYDPKSDNLIPCKLVTRYKILKVAPYIFLFLKTNFIAISSKQKNHNLFTSRKVLAPVWRQFNINLDNANSTLNPREAGLKFIEGDILQIVNQDDPNWWQAKLEGGEGQAGLIPGLILQEQRMAGIKDAVPKNSAAGCGATNSSRRRKKKKNKKLNYSANKNAGMFTWGPGNIWYHCSEVRIFAKFSDRYYSNFNSIPTIQLSQILTLTSWFCMKKSLKCRLSTERLW